MADQLPLTKDTTDTVPLPLEQASESRMSRSIEAGDVLGIIEKALTSGRDMSELTELYGLLERIADRNARQEFSEALAAFQDECPPIGKNRTAEIATEKGAKFSYTYADLPEIVRVARPLLTARGFSFTWDAETQDGGKMVIAVCTLRHSNGHTEKASFPAPTESRAGMSPSQKFGAAFNYAKRQAFVAVVGLTTCDPDDDGAGYESRSTEAITAVQLEKLLGLMKELDVDEARFLKFAKAETVEAITQGNYDVVIAELERKRGES